MKRGIAPWKNKTHCNKLTTIGSRRENKGGREEGQNQRTEEEGSRRRMRAKSAAGDDGPRWRREGIYRNEGKNSEERDE